MDIHVMRKKGVEFLKKHEHPGYARLLKRKCLGAVTEPLLKRYGKWQLLLLYGLMDEDLKKAFLFWFTSSGCEKLRKKLEKIDWEYRNLRSILLGSSEPHSNFKSKKYFDELESVIVGWLRKWQHRKRLEGQEGDY